MINKLNNLRENHFESGFGGCKTYRKPKRKALVTIVVGLVGANSIVLVSDSRTTKPDGTIDDEAQKISIINLKDVQALVAQSGNADFSSRAVDILTQKASEKSLDDYRTIADLAQEAVKELKHQIRNQYESFKCSMEEFQKHFSDYDFSLMIAHYDHHRKPRIFTIDFLSGIAVERKKEKVTMGCGANLADFLLSCFEVKTMGLGSCSTSGVYVVEQVKKFDARCGGKTRIGSTWFSARTDDPPAITLVEDQRVQDIVEGTAKIDKTIKDDWKKKIYDVVKEVAEKFKSYKAE